MDFSGLYRRGGAAWRFSELRPAFDGKPLSMVLVIQMFMLLSGALIIIITKLTRHRFPK
nr:Anaerobic C4-dicarboxylate transporter DcuB [Klebsiella pneumoniae]